MPDRSELFVHERAPSGSGGAGGSVRMRMVPGWRGAGTAVEELEDTARMAMMRRK